MFLQTPRLILRKPEPKDVDDHLEFACSEFVLRYNAMTPPTREKAEARFAEAPNDGSVLVMEEKATGKVIGMLYTEEDSLRYGVESREFSYYLREDRARKGFMKEALHALIGHLFETEKLDCVSARCFAPNIASQRLLESLGFRRDGIVRRCVRGWGDTVFDDCLYSLMREEFK